MAHDVVTKPGLDVPENKFSVPVDSNDKALKINVLSFAFPHMRAFHLSWIAFFVVFVSTFAPAALLTVVREDLDMTKTDLGNAGIAAVVGAIASRIAMGNVCDTWGPRYGLSFVCLFTAPPVFAMVLADGPGAFIAIRFFIGIGLSNFVACQFWCSQMFTNKVVGTANAVAAGWGNAGGGVTIFIMPNLYAAIMANNVTSFAAWRWSFFFPGALHVIIGLAVLLLGQDMPTGNYRELVKSGDRVKPNGFKTVMVAIRNYRTWVLTFVYGYCFGVELTMNNIATAYMVDQFGMALTTAGNLGAVFGLLNFVTRPSGGMLSDLATKYYGMRGRIWVLWICQTLGGVFCAIMGLMSHSLALTMVFLVLFAITAQQAQGLSMGVAPFASKRAQGQVMGFIGAGGNAGAAVTQALFFSGSIQMSTSEGMVNMGIMIVAVTALLAVVYFPMWGGMFKGPKEGVTEEDYYLAEYTAEEKASGLHATSLKFAYESKSERQGGWAKAGFGAPPPPPV